MIVGRLIKTQQGVDTLAYVGSALLLRLVLSYVKDLPMVGFVGSSVVYALQLLATYNIISIVIFGFLAWWRRGTSRQ